MKTSGKVKVRIHLSGSLKAILEDKSEELVVEFDRSLSIKDLLLKIEIPPLVVVKAVVNGRPKSKDFRIEDDAEIILIGPVAGG
jgi:molybdopterin converting factor small subunit